MHENKELTDEEIVEKIRNSNQEFYAILIERYQKKLLRYVNNIIKDENKTIDIVQESFIKTFINLNSFNTKKKFSSWLYRITHNQMINTIKKYKKEVPLLEKWDFESEENIEKNFEEKELIKKIEKCLDKIPLLYSEPISLYYFEEKSYEEISDILKIPMGTVAVRINRAKKIMKNICQKI
jgi:RNA polymerase sigma-70 factor (ECF subfamily)